MNDRITRAKIHVGLGALTLAAVFAAAPAVAQEVWQTYPMTISSPAFGPGPAQQFAAPAARAERPARTRRPLYNTAARVDAPRGGHACEVWETYPMTISTPANYLPTSCQ